MKTLYYGKKHDEIKYKDYEIIQDEARDKGENILCYEYEIDHKHGSPWCSENLEIDPECSRECNDYNPCNGKSGKCRKLKKTLKENGKKFVIKYDNEYFYALLKKNKKVKYGKQTKKRHNKKEKYKGE